ncbi:kinase-like domain-containing protein [Lineolata rhizophorae]|uniref:Kinase-like domain-containing protein n=1 Tax=Lineolata rhizophorae TaxID=578093 RepID=A0A6A6P1V8_9PEZI|nr:kinase-like domain-containing protein [Lineolata rhizophorae]
MAAVFSFDAIDKHLSPVGNAAGQNDDMSPMKEAQMASSTAGLQAGQAVEPVKIAICPETPLTPIKPPDDGRMGPHSRVGGSGTPHATSTPVRIASPSPARHATPTPGPAADAGNEKLDFDALRAKVAKKKKKKRNAKQAASPAMNTIRGFQTPPITSGGEESDFSVASTPRLGPRLNDLPSTTGSPRLGASSGAAGVSALKLQLDTLNLGSSGRSTPMKKSQSNSGGSDSDKTEMDTYEVSLEHDFVSPDVPTKSSLGPTEGGLRQDSLARKMTAGDFEPLNCLGKGTFGTVLLVRQRATGRLYAQKQFRKASLTVHKRLVEQTKTERTILESVNRHPFIVNLYYAFQDHEKLYLILEYASGGELFHHLNMEHMFSEQMAAFYMAELVLALEHLHHNTGVVYRDLKPENCLLDADGHLLLTDFGLSKVAVDGSDRCNSVLGTVDYMAPEVVRGAEYGMAVDWWSLGALGFDLMTGSPPFSGANHAKTQERILKAKLALPYYLSPDAKDLLTRLLRKEPRRRLGANMPKDLTTIKQHRFFRKVNWAALKRRELEPPIKPLITDPALAENFAREFTDVPLSPVVGSGAPGGADWKTDAGGAAAGQDVFGGFSFVASSSLLEAGVWGN